MPRQARKKSCSGIYHLMMRGINRQVIFEDRDDYEKFMETLERFKGKSDYEIYAYCLMSNHVHLLIKVGQEPLEQIMRRICASYVRWYNTKYQRVGYLFQDRFKSEVVENEGYFLTVLRYIHQNPVKAGLVTRLEQYQWSSWSEYLKIPRMIDVSFVLKLFDDDRVKALEKYTKFCQATNEEQCLDMKEGRLISDIEARKIILRVFRVDNILDLQKVDKVTRNKYLKELRDKYCLSIRRLERLTGISRGIIQKVR